MDQVTRQIWHDNLSKPEDCAEAQGSLHLMAAIPPPMHKTGLSAVGPMLAVE